MPTAGITAYLIVRLLYVIIPLIGFGLPVIYLLKEPQSFFCLALTSIFLLITFVVQILSPDALPYWPSIYLLAFLVVGISQREDLFYLINLLPRKT